MGEVGSAEQTVTVRYWAAAREAAGVDSERLGLGADATVSDAVAAAVAAHPDLARVATVATFLSMGGQLAGTRCWRRARPSRSCRRSRVGNAQ